MKAVNHIELTNIQLLLKFYYLMYMTEHLNQFNMLMHVIGNVVSYLQQSVYERMHLNKQTPFSADS